MARLALCFLLTAAIEGGVMLALRREWRPVYYSLLCNLLTNPALNTALMLIYPRVGTSGRAAALALLELAAVAAEAAVYRVLCGWSFGRALWTSALLNACSFALGLLIFR